MSDQGTGQEATRAIPDMQYAVLLAKPARGGQHRTVRAERHGVRVQPSGVPSGERPLTKDSLR